MRLRFRPGLETDSAPLAAPDGLRWLRSNNIRFYRDRSSREHVAVETLGPVAAIVDQTPTSDAFEFSYEFAPGFDITNYPGDQLVFDFAPHTLFPFARETGAVGVLIAGVNDIQVLISETGSTSAHPLFANAAINTFTSPNDTALLTPTDPWAGPIQPFWWFFEQDDLIVGGRAGADFPAYVWDKDETTGAFAAISNCPSKAVGGAIVNRILVLLGCESLTDPDPRHELTIRWSDRYDFTEWTPADTNLSGELQLEGGSRIIGGGFSRFGVVAWTDRNMVILTETGDNNVFAREYVDGAAGLLGNRAWCEAGGRLWWLDQDRTLCVYDGGAARSVPCPIAATTLDARDYPIEQGWFQMTPVPMFDEIWISYRAGADGMNRTVIYNYELDVWYAATHFARASVAQDYFTAFSPAFGGFPILSAFHVIVTVSEEPADRYVLSLHEMTDAVPEQYEIFDGDSVGVDATLFRPSSFFLESAPFVLTEDVPTETARSVHAYVDARVNTLEGAPDGASELRVTMSGIRKRKASGNIVSQTQTWSEDAPELDFRVAGRHLKIRIDNGVASNGAATALGRVRFGDIWISAEKDARK